MNFYNYLFAHLTFFAKKFGSGDASYSGKVYMDMFLLMVLAGPICFGVLMATYSLIAALSAFGVLMIAVSIFNKRYFYRKRRYEEILKHYETASVGKRITGMILSVFLVLFSFTLPFLIVYLIIVIFNIPHIEV
ncbi:hypothetical protein [Chitinophaga sp. Cy-1792]|uniref:hypothetical protein n=1 Tax=Chitinophaga sp. Cy-1792 TaxID=2608339 RepID=UPI001420E261|nr:hypothetical protein [Chitinophaga sp. Cy-1792]NIG53537.1 hypothetical protein [Chitinophaga sp. Cy-1792]